MGDPLGILNKAKSQPETQTQASDPLGILKKKDSPESGTISTQSVNGGNQDQNTNPYADIVSKVFQQYPALNSIAKPEDYLVMPASGKLKDILNKHDAGLEFQQKGQTDYRWGNDSMALDNPDKNRVYLNTDKLKPNQIEDAIKLDMVSHGMHGNPEYDAFVADLNKKLVDKYGAKMVENNGGADAYIRGYLSNSPEYQPYKDETKFLPQGYFDRLDKILKTPPNQNNQIPESTKLPFGVNAFNKYKTALQNIAINLPVYSKDIPKGGGLLPSKEQQNQSLLAQSTEPKFEGQAPEQQNSITSWAQKQIENIDQIPNSSVFGEPQKIALKSILGNIGGAASGFEQISQAGKEMNEGKESPSNIISAPTELAAGLVKTGFSGLSLVHPELMAFSAATQAAEDALPQGVVQKAMSPISSLLQATHGIISYNGRIYDLGNSNGVKAAAELGDLAVNILLFHGLKVLAGKVQSNLPLDPQEQKQVNGAIDDASKDFAKESNFQKETLFKIPVDIPDKTKSEIAPKIEQKQNLQKENENLQQQKTELDPAFHPAIDEKIDKNNEKAKDIDEEVSRIYSDVPKLKTQTVTKTENGITTELPEQVLPEVRPSNAEEIQTENIQTNLPKTESNATTESQITNQESDQQPGVEEHPGVSPSRNEAAITGADNSYRGINSERPQQEEEIIPFTELPIDAQEIAKDFERGDINDSEFSKKLLELGYEPTTDLDFAEGGEGQMYFKKIPPPENPPIKGEQLPPEGTGIKNAVTLSERAQKGMDEVEVEARRTFGDAFEAGKKAVDDGIIDPSRLAASLAKNPRPLKPEESVALLYDRMRLKNQHERVMDDVIKATTDNDKQAQEEGRVRLAAIEDAINTNDEAARRTGYEQGLGLAIRRMMIRKDYSADNLLQRARVANGGNELSHDVRTRIENLSSQIKELQQKVGSLETELAKTKEEKQNFTQKAKKVADKIRKLKEKPIELRDENGNIINIQKQGLDWNDLIEGIAVAVEKGGELADAISEHLEKADWYKNLTAAGKRAVSEQIENQLSTHAKEEKSALDKYKDSLRKRKEVLEERIKNPTLEKKQRAPKPEDAETYKLQTEIKRLQNKADIEIKKLELAKRTPLQKLKDTFIKWQRAFKLSSPLTIAKLTAAAMTRMIQAPIEETIGAGISKIPGLKKIAEGAPREGGGSIKAEAKAITDAFTKGLSDAWKVLKTGKSEIDVNFGDKLDLPPEASNFMGQMHSALKTTAKRNEFSRSFEKRIAWKMKNGVDVTDPMVQTQTAVEAYKDAQRSIFMQPNKISDAYQNFVHSLELQKSTSAQTTSAVLQFFVPFVRVPTNIVAEAGTMIGGIPIGTAKAVDAVFRKGIENLKPEEKDEIIRNLKKGSIGTALLLVGYFNPDHFGGLYQAGMKGKQNKNAETGSIKIGDTNIPSWLLHSPMFIVPQVGATIRYLKDYYVNNKKEPEWKSFSEATFAGLLGLTAETPLLDQVIRNQKLFGNPTDRQYWLEDLAKNTTDPALLQQIAKWMDKGKERKSSTMLQSIEEGLPVLRENVPLKSGKSNALTVTHNQ